MNAPFCLRRLLLFAGLGLLAIYAGIRLDGALQSRARLHSFGQRRAPTSWNGSLGRAAAVDFSRWSPQRIRGYQASLEADLNPPLAVLRIAKIALEVPVLAGIDEVTLNRGVGWIEGTATPGTAGNVGIAGHRDGFFRGLKDLQVGDTLELQTLRSQDRYVVDAVEIVGPHEISVLGPRAGHSLTLVTCYPFYFVGNAPQRFIVHASLADEAMIPANRTSAPAGAGERESTP